MQLQSKGVNDSLCEQTQIAFFISYTRHHQQHHCNKVMFTGSHKTCFSIPISLPTPLPHVNIQTVDYAEFCAVTLTDGFKLHVQVQLKTTLSATEQADIFKTSFCDNLDQTPSPTFKPSSKSPLPLGALRKVNTFKILFGANSTCSLPQASHSGSYIKLLSPQEKNYERKVVINYFITRNLSNSDKLSLPALV